MSIGQGVTIIHGVVVYLSRYCNADIGMLHRILVLFYAWYNRYKLPDNICHFQKIHALWYIVPQFRQFIKLSDNSSRTRTPTRAPAHIRAYAHAHAHT